MINFLFNGTCMQVELKELSVEKVDNRGALIQK